MIRVRIVASTSVSAAGLEAMLLHSGRFELVKTVAADVVLFEAGGSIKRALQRVHEHSQSGCVMLADEVSRRELIRALHSGVLAVLPSSCTPDELSAAIEAAATGLAAFTPEQLEMLLPAAADDVHDDLVEPLTARESQVLELLAQGLSNKQISTALQVSEHTVKFHVSSIITKLGVAGRTEAVTRGLREGLILL
jgi:NarL family two-component system response regulator YdfI